MTAPMIETFTALILAHLLADFVTQTNWMVRHKSNPGVLALHGLHVFALTALLLGGSLVLALGIALAHVLTDAIKQHLLAPTLRSFLADQAAHLAVLGLASFLLPTAFASGFWPTPAPETLQLAWIAGGFILATLAGGPAVGLLMAPYRIEEEMEGLQNAGRIIGLLERALIFLFILIKDPAAIGFLIAAKSILRFDTVSQDRKISEYVIIGTLASFGWALAVSYATASTIAWLAP